METQTSKATGVNEVYALFYLNNLIARLKCEDGLKDEDIVEINKSSEFISGTGNVIVYDVVHKKLTKVIPLCHHCSEPWDNQEECPHKDCIPRKLYPKLNILTIKGAE